MGVEKGLGTRGGQNGRKKKKAKKANSRICAFWAWRKWGFALVREVLLIWRKGERDS